MTKQNFSVCFGEKKEFDDLLNKYHYLQAKEKRSYKTGVNIILKYNNEIVGVAIFTGFPVPELCVGLYGLQRNEQKGLYELSRFCIKPNIQESEHNIATWFLSRAIKLLKKNYDVKALLSYADSKYHNGIIYKAYGFKYYGLTAPKKDWKPINSDIPSSRGCKGEGMWVDRTRKHRYLITYDKSLKPKWTEKSYV